MMATGLQSRIAQLMLVILPRRYLEFAEKALLARGLKVIGINSIGGFLSVGNCTLLIGVPEGTLEGAIHELEGTCRSRVEFHSLPAAEVGHSSLATPIPVTVRGATVFAFDVEKSEEF